MKEVRIEDSAGLTLAYDLTEIVPGQRKGAVLRRGHIIRESDLETLRRIGKSTIKVLELEANEVHEDEAAVRLAAMIAGRGLEVTRPGEAWADVKASIDGLLRVASPALLAINSIGELLVATLHNGTPVKRGTLVAKAKVLGLMVGQERLSQAHGVATWGPVLQVLPFRKVSAGLVVTGREIYEGRVKEAFGPLLRDRLAEYGGEIAHSVVVPDEVEPIVEAIRGLLARGVDLVMVTGGMSPDDCTPEAVRRSGAEMAFYGAPVSPGAMTLLAYVGAVPIVGVPAGLLAKPRGFLDTLLPRLLVGERLGVPEVARFGEGGLCLACPTCVFPACPFGKGG
ncbi:MAG TPA: molybdopterin-binding protein [Bacillota bacterium]|jgi:hypothetical protein